MPPRAHAFDSPVQLTGMSRERRSATAGTVDYDWVIIGGGPIGVHVAVRLLADGGVSAKRLCIIDPGPELLHRWNCCTASTGMRFLRSPAVHHVGVEPFGLLQHAGRRKRDRKKRALFAPPYNRPSLALFASHTASVMKAHDIVARHVQDRVEHVHLGDDSARVCLGSGRSVTAAQVVLAIGNSEAPVWPPAAVQLRDAGGCVRHVFEGDGPLDPETLPASVVVLGGGISAAQVAVRLADSGRKVTVLARHSPREHQFDSDPGWIGPKYMRGFAAESDPTRRRALITKARHRGSMPSDVKRDLQIAMNNGTVSWKVGTLAGGSMDGETMVMHLEDGQEPLTADALLLATGFSSRRPGGALVDALISEHELPVAECGYPLVDTDLRWHPRLFTTGPLAELELGPAARNLTGGRRAADRLVEVARTSARPTGMGSSVTRALATASAALLAVVGIGCQDADSSSKSGSGAGDASAEVEDSGATDDTGEAVPVAPVPPMGNLLIEEVYYAGAEPAAGIDRYYSDQFIELVNVSDAPVMLGGLMLGDAYGLAGAINPGDRAGGPYVADPDFVYLSSIWRIPGAPEDVLLEPGASLVIAQDAGEHNPYSPVDHSDADYETYVEVYGEDMDDAFVPNLESVWYTAGYDWLVTVFGPTIVIVSGDEAEFTQVGHPRYGPMEVPASAVVDTMEALMDGDSGDFKRLHESIDSGFIHVSGTYTGESVRRKRDESGQLIDTNNTGADFEVLSVPEPGVGFLR